VRRIIGETLTEQSRGLDPQSVQWLVRSAYEEGWREAGGDDAVSHHSEAPKGWRSSWMMSKSRSILKRQGMISGEDSYK
ncbi:hypothetical protein ACXWO5_10435, partial [Streptococcus pyogenes]